MESKGYLSTFFLALTCLLISTFICFVAPGNYQRRNIIEDQQVVKLFSFSSDINFVFSILLQKKLGIAILLSLLWMLLGIKMRENSKDRLCHQKAKSVLIICLTAIVGSLLINIIFKMIFLKNALMPARTLTFTSFFIAAFMCLLFLFAGYYLFYKVKRFPLLLPFIPCCSMIIMFAYAFKQHGLTSRYAKQHDELIHTLLVAKVHAEKKVMVHTLPDPGMLLPLYVQDQRWTLQEILELPYEIRVE